MDISKVLHRLVNGDVFLLLPNKPHSMASEEEAKMLFFQVTPDMTMLQWSDPYTHQVYGSMPLHQIQNVRYGMLTCLPRIYQPWLVFSLICEEDSASVASKQICMHLHASEEEDIVKWLSGLQTYMVLRQRQKNPNLSVKAPTTASLMWKVWKVKHKQKARVQKTTLCKYLAHNAGEKKRSSRLEAALRRKQNRTRKYHPHRPPARSDSDTLVEQKAGSVADALLVRKHAVASEMENKDLNAVTIDADTSTIANQTVALSVD